MNHIKKTSFNAQRGRIHPLMATAAVAVTLVSLVGIAAITGVIPSSHGTTAPAIATPDAFGLTGNPSTASGEYRTGPATGPVVTQAPAYVQNPQPVPTYAPPPMAERAPQQVVERVPQQVAVANGGYAQPYPNQGYQIAQGPAICHSCGRVESVVAIHEAVRPSGVGIAAGAVLGGILGNHVGNGNGRTLATVAGAVAGGYGGNEVEKRTRSTTSYQVRVRMEDGHVRTFPQHGEGWRVGDRVRVVNGALTSRG